MTAVEELTSSKQKLRSTLILRQKNFLGVFFEVEYQMHPIGSYKKRRLRSDGMKTTASG